MWELNYKESWAPKNCCFWTVVLEKTVESPLDCKEINPVNPKGNQSWISVLEGLMLKVKLQYFGHLMQRADLFEKTTWKDWRWEEKGTTEDEMVGCCHQLNGHEFEQAPWVGDGQGSLVCCSPWGRRVRHDWTIELNWNCTWWFLTFQLLIVHC